MKSQIFTTAHHTDLRLTNTGTVDFNEFVQPKETDASIIVDESKQFQTFMGIGAALTDASAETFYKLSKENQDLTYVIKGSEEFIPGQRRLDNEVLLDINGQIKTSGYYNINLADKIIEKVVEVLSPIQNT